MTAKRGGLGKGLDSLIKENKTAKHTAPVKKDGSGGGRYYRADDQTVWGYL